MVTTVPQIELCALVSQLLRKSGDLRLREVSMDNDNDSGEVIVMWNDGKEDRDFVIKPYETELDDEYSDENILH